MRFPLTTPSARTRIPPVFWLLATTLVGAAIAGSLRWGVNLPWGEELPADLLVYRQAGRAAWAGVPLYGGAFPTWDGGNGLPLVYPPVSALLAVPLGWFPAWAVAAAWSAVCLLALTVIVVVSFGPPVRRWVAQRVPRGRPGRQLLLASALVGAACVASLALVPVNDVLHFGQVGLLLPAAVLVDVVVLGRRGSRAQGVLVGLATAVKLTSAVFVLAWCVQGRWRAAGTAVATTLGAWTIAGVVLWRDSVTYFGSTLVQGEGMIPASSAFLNQSVSGVLVREGLDGWGHRGLWLAISCGLLIGGLWVARRLAQTGDLVAAAAVVGLCGVLVSPVSWVHHAVWVVPGIAAILGTRPGCARADRWQVVVAAGAFLAFSYAAYPVILEDAPLAHGYFVAAYLALVVVLALPALPRAGPARAEPTQAGG